MADWVTATQDATGVSTAAEAYHTLLAVLDAMGDVLTRDEAEAIAREIPEGLGRVIRGAAARVAEPPPTDALEAFIHGVEWRENLYTGFAFEHATAVCRVLAARLSPGTRARLAADLPRAIADLLAPPAPAPRIERTPRAPGVPPRSTLATGRPFSEHPVSEARADRAHGQSVARSDNPHGDTKLSSSKGLTQERLGDSLATGLPGPTRKVSESH